jgi:chemotaxis-related protein WspB
MLFLLFQLGENRYALEASRVVEVVPLLALQQLPQAPRGVAGIFNYRGRPVPAVDLAALTLGQPARECFSTRIIIINYPDDSGTNHLVGLIAEHATELLRKDAKDFADPGVKLGAAPYLGPVFMDGTSSVRLIYEQRLLPEPVRQLLFSAPKALCHETH